MTTAMVRCAALAGVPNTSSHHAEAQVAAVRILVNAIRPRTLT